MIKVLDTLTFYILIYFAVLWVGYTVLLLGTFLTVIRKYKESKYNSMISKLNTEPTLPVSIIIPAFNESKRISNAIDALLKLDYKNIHIIVVNDGSTDDTLDLLIKNYALQKIPPAFMIKYQTGTVLAYYHSTTIPNMIVIDKEHSPFANSAADCINAGLNVCRTPLYMTVDADTLLEPEALTRMLFMYLIHPHCLAIGGNIYVPDPKKIQQGKMLDTNIPSNFVLGVQVCEYLRSFSYGREGWLFLGGALCHPGAITMLETQAVHEVGGYDASNFSYDAEMIIKLHHFMRKNKHPYSIVYSPSSIAWSEEPKTIRHLWRQRSYWQRGLLRCLSRHKDMVFNPAYGITGILAFPYYILFEIFGPVVEAISYIILILVFIYSKISLLNLAWLIFLAWGYMMFITLSCVILNLLTYNKYYKKMDILHLFFLTTVDMFFYRQVRAFCCLISSVQYVIHRLRGKPQ